MPFKGFSNELTVTVHQRTFPKIYGVPWPIFFQNSYNSFFIKKIYKDQVLKKIKNSQSELQFTGSIKKECIDFLKACLNYIYPVKKYRHSLHNNHKILTG